LSYFVIDWL